MFKTLKQSSYHIVLLVSMILLIYSNFLINNIIVNQAVTAFCFSLVFIVTIFSIKTSRKQLLYFSLAIVIIRLASNYLIDSKILQSFTTLISVIFFFVIVYKLIYQVMKSEVVNSVVIFESINAYLLIGLSNSILAGLIYKVSENAYSFSNPMNESLSDFIYYGFITQTTIGYGDISPVSELAKLHSITFGIAGQLYLTILIAILVGKFLSQKREKA
jgi:Ion channel